MKKRSMNMFSSILSRSVQTNSADSPGLPRWGWRCLSTLAERQFGWKQSCVLWGLQSICQQCIYYSPAKPSVNTDTNGLLIWNYFPYDRAGVSSCISWQEIMQTHGFVAWLLQSSSDSQLVWRNKTLLVKTLLIYVYYLTTKILVIASIHGS